MFLCLILVVNFVNLYIGIIESFSLKIPFQHSLDPDEFINTTTLIRSKGYFAEEHQVLTDDGYIITIHRIPFGRNESSSSYRSEKKVPVFLQHGLLDASSSWVINFENESLGFILADCGFDVWMGNVRGNTYGRNHTYLKPSQIEFWNFSWQQISEFDLPAMINYVLKKTEHEQLYYIGHSQGTLIGFAEFSRNPELASKIKSFFALGPVATLGHMRSPFRLLADVGTRSKQQIWYTLFGKKDFLPSDAIVEWLADRACTSGSFLCKNLLYVIAGPCKYLNQSRIAVYTTHDPAGTSVRNLAHFAQLSISNKFQAYDYGSPKANQLVYNQTEPPVYDVTNLQIPVALYWGQDDWLADPIDVSYLIAKLPNLFDGYAIADWGHLDFIWATNAREHLYNRIVALINKNENK